jgi:hypothetical protein
MSKCLVMVFVCGDASAAAAKLTGASVAAPATPITVAADRKPRRDSSGPVGSPITWALVLSSRSPHPHI